MPSLFRGDTRMALVGPAIVALAVVGILTAPGCGGGKTDQRAGGTDTARAGENTYQGDGFSFTYPEDWILWEFTQGPPDRKLPAVGLRSSGPATPEGVFVFVYEAVDEDNLDDAVDDLASEGGPFVVAPTPTSVDGIPAVRYEDSNGAGTIAYDDTTWYVIAYKTLSGSTPSLAEELKQVYDRVVASFQVE